MSRCDLLLWPVDLESFSFIMRYVIKVCTKYERNRSIPGWIIDNFANFCTRCVTLWPRPLTSWPWTFTEFRVSKFERNRIIHGWVIDDLARFRLAMLGVGNFTEQFSVLRGPNFTKLGENIGRLFLYNKCVSEFGYLAAFSNAGGSNLSDVKNDTKLRTFWPPPLWKLGKGWARSLNQLLQPYLRPNFLIRNTFHCAAAERGGFIKRRKKQKETSLWVKRVAFKTNAGRLHYASISKLEPTNKYQRNII